MVGLGTIVNVISIFFGGLLGIHFKHRLKDRYKQVATQAIGLATLVIGFSGVLSGIYYIQDQQIHEQYIFEIIIILVVGAIIGAFLKLSQRLDHFGLKVEQRFQGTNDQFAQGFVSATLIFCIGAMSIMGAIQDGMNQNYNILFSKSILDGITAMVLSSTLGWGVIFSVGPVFIYQMLITIIAYFFGNFLPEEARLLMTVIGNVLIIGISLVILEIKKIEVADFLPALFLPIIYVLLKQWIV